MLAIDVLAATGAGAAGPSVLMAAVSRRISPDKRGMTTGLVNAGGSFGQFTIAPLAGALLAGIGWVGAPETLALVTLLVLPVALWLRTPPAAPGERHVIEGTQLRDPSYLLLCAGFFVCGFHVAFIATHLPGVVGRCGLPPQVAAWSLAVIVLFNIELRLRLGDPGAGA
ncbi:MAG TPA: MFS transporter [Burkholderiales bacterium]|nr:MFS transporter [Burkholderiales bacterium]